MNARIASAVLDICQFVEANIVGQEDPVMCSWWARKNAFRHAVTISSIVCHARLLGERRIRILNMSGLSCGHQDFSICHYLRQVGIEFEYFAIEHPNSSYLKMPAFMAKVQEFNIEVLLLDLKDADARRIREVAGAPDIILFTEIAEHLEHRELLRAFESAAALLEGDAATLIITTPNLDCFDYRIRHLLGREASHWGDGYANLHAGLFGHIVYYNIPRLRRLLNDAGLNVAESRTFNFPEPDPKLTGLRRLSAVIKLRVLNCAILLGERSWQIPGLLNASKTLGEMLYVEARKGARVEIPFAL